MLPQMWRPFQHHPIWTVSFKPNLSCLRPVFSIMKTSITKTQMPQKLQIRPALIWREKNLISLRPKFVAEVGTETEMLKKHRFCPATIWREKRRILWIHRREGDCTNVWMIWWQLWGNFQQFSTISKTNLSNLIKQNKRSFLLFRED